MVTRALVGIGLFAACASAALGQIVNPSQDPKLAADVAALQSVVPLPATTAPLTDTMNGSVGNDPGVYALAKHQHPRITASPTVYTTAGGSFSGTFPAGLFNAKPTIALTWLTTGATGPVACEMRTITTTTFSGRCTTLLGLVAAGGGIEVDVVALPNSAP